ncbi:phage portal protein [Orbus wheelerorum]|uniref:phage portal protein n=1 Tax=Orbus wheelerorum TaxID=3074111 RepID=UPI00370D7632
MKLFNFLKKSKPQDENTPPPYYDYIRNGSQTGLSVSPNNAMTLTGVFSCVRVLAESVGMLPCFLYEDTGSERKKAIRDDLYKLLYIAPNDYMTPQEFWECIMTNLCLRGNFYAYKVKINGKVKELLPLDAGAVFAKLDNNWQPVYQVTFPDGNSQFLTQDDIWHVRIFTKDSFLGISPITQARKAAELAMATEQFGSGLFGNGAVSSGVLQTDQTLTDESFNRLKKEFTENHTGLSNAHKPMILEMGLKWNQISMSSEDAQFLETRKFQLEEICRIFRVPLHLVQNTDRATFSNIENLGMGFVNYSLIPYLTRIEQRINIGLVEKSKQGRFYAKFNVGALMRGDMSSRYKSYATGINWGILSPNECRDLEDRNPREGGDVFLTPLNMTANTGKEDEEQV